jgi:putative MATE family efflux protein
MDSDDPHTPAIVAELRGPRPRRLAFRVDLATTNVSKAVLALALPMFMAAILQTAASIVKLYWVGQLGRDALASVAVCESIAFLLFPLLIGLSTGTTAIVARAIGAGDSESAALTAAQSILLATVLGVASAFAGRSFSTLLVSLIGRDPDVIRQGSHYLDVLLLGVVPLFVMCIVASVLQAMGHTAEPMFATVGTVAATFVLVPLLIFGTGPFPALGLTGAAWATVVVDTAGAILCLALLFHHRDELRFHRRHWRPHLPILRRVVRIGIPGFGQLLLRMVAGATMMRIAASCGTVAVAAYGVGLRFDTLLLTPVFAIGDAAATMSGISLGGRDPERARSAAWRASAISLAAVLPAVAVMLVFAPRIVTVFSRDAAVVSIASHYLRTVWPFHLFTALSVPLGRAMQGAGDTVSSIFVAVVGLWCLQIPLAKFLVDVWNPPYQGLWWAIAAAAAVQGVILTAVFERGKWKTKAV